MNYQPVNARNRSNGNAGLEKVHDQEYILLPLMHTSSNVPSNSEEDESSPKDNARKKNEFKDPIKEGDMNGPEEETNTNSTNRFNTVSSPVNTVSLSFTTVDPGRAKEQRNKSAYDDEYVGAEADLNNLESNMSVSTIPITSYHKDHPKAQIIREVDSVVQTRRMHKQNEARLITFINKQRRTNHKDFQNCLFACFLSQLEPKKGYRQEEGVDYDEVFAPMARIEAIRLFLAFASYMDFTVYQMDVKSAFLYGNIDEEVYVSQPPAPRAWHETLSTYLLENGFKRRTIDKTLFIKKIKNDIILVQVYVDDIIFGSTKESLSTEFEQLMHKRFQMSSIGELTFFLGLQIASTPLETHKPLSKDTAGTDVDVHLYRFMIGSLMYLTSSRPDIMFAMCACSRFQVQPKASHMHAVKRIFRYLKGQPNLGLWYPKNSPMDLIAYSDSDYASASLDRKSTTGGCQFLGCRLISWQCKKQIIVVNSTTEAEYITTSNCRRQVLWLQNQLLDYEYNFIKIKIHVDNESTICVVKNPVYHSKTKHREIRHHFIRDSYEKKLIEMVKIHIDYNVADLLTKAFDVTRFQFLIAALVTSAVGEQGINAVKSSACWVWRLKRNIVDHGDPQVALKDTGIFDSGCSRHMTGNNLVVPLTKVGDEAVHKEFGDRMERAATTASSLEAEHDIGKTITEASLRRHLKLEDNGGVTTLLNSEIFEQLALMGFSGFWKIHGSKLWKDNRMPTISIDGLQSSLHKVGNLLSLSLSN
ncbi:putative ribonuclease H-like domain-containing protein [Tanacetum coccineum]|uniref:Ribonuclease H-like domain-containing protein n=1 Tax=Tanacetum coccineum TaxID=301880 RepID=A0ABQ4YBX7_9ASTR